MAPCLPRCSISRAARCAWRRSRSPNRAPAMCCSRSCACGACRTDLHIRRRRARRRRACRWSSATRSSARAERRRAAGLRAGDRVGVPWLGWACGECAFCRSRAREPLRARALHRPSMSTAASPSARSPTRASACRCRPATPTTEVAPLLCAGLIGARALRMAGDARRLGLYGFGAAAHIVAQVARHEGRRVFAFTRAGDEAAQAFARELGCEWAGDVARARRRSRSTRRSSSPPPASSCPRRCARSSAAARRLRRDPHERHPRRSRTSCCGASARCARSPT